MEKSKHVCKFCSKVFPCGRSLGGHMRSHLIHISSTEKKLPPLRDRTQRRRSHEAAAASMEDDDDDDDGDCDEIVCKECGKSFHSWKALFGHMKCHSIIGKEDSVSVLSENEASKKKKRSSKRYTNTNSSSILSPCVSEQEEVAMSLILLSMDHTNSLAQSHNTSFDSNKTVEVEVEVEVEETQLRASAIKKVKSSQDFEIGCSESEVNSPKNFINKKGPFTSDQNKKRKKMKIDDSEIKSSPTSKFSCIICHKAFRSYQALGGHRASHKKFKGCCAPTADDRAPNLSETIEECKKIKEHECPICYKSFPSGQALGGHKRSHLISDQAKINDSSSVSVERRIPEVRDFLDLNLPAPLEEPWWIATTHTNHGLLFSSS